MATEINLASTQIADSSWQVPAHEVYEFAPRLTRFCVCIPVINEGNRIKNQLTLMKELGISRLADVLILDGGSTDGSLVHGWLKDSGVNSLLIKTGAGKLSAQLRIGYAWALRRGYDGVITIDGNGKDGVEAIPDFMRQLEAGYDFVQGSRYVPGGKAINTSLQRAIASNQ